MEVERGAAITLVMRCRSAAVAGIACVLILCGLLLNLTNGAAWLWVIVTLATMSAMLTLVPQSRLAGVVALVLWGACAIALVHPKYLGSVAFAALDALVVALAMSFAPALASWTLVPVAFTEGGWLAALGRQTIFEITTVGHPTNAFDGCTQALLPLALDASVLLVVVVGVVLYFGTTLVLRDGRYVRRTPSPGVYASSPWRLAFSLALTAGVIVGLTSWSDWQINQPCL